MNLKTIGIIVIIVGLLMTLYTGYNYVTRENIMTIGDTHLSMDKHHTTAWSPFLGLGIIVIGGVVFLAGRKKKLV
jgi:LPXTG-motif cell wall-anchored protein